MTVDKQKYMDWESAPDDGTDSPDEANFKPTAHVMPLPHSELWHGVWATHAIDGHEELEGTKDEVVAWATERCETMWVWSEAAQDIVLVAS
ncbi:MAG: hypothetical protein JWN95_737 [Frankiales bacterium]|nr:hypothetical protein [Frankiales bacterium]